MDKVVFTAGVVGKSSKVFKEPTLYVQAGKFKGAVGSLEKRDLEIISEVKILVSVYYFRATTIK